MEGEYESVCGEKATDKMNQHFAGTQSMHQPQTTQHHGTTSNRTRTNAQRDSVLTAARAAQRVKHACTIDEDELLALRPTLLKGYASLQDQSRSAVMSLCTSARCYFRIVPAIITHYCCHLYIAPQLMSTSGFYDWNPYWRDKLPWSSSVLPCTAMRSSLCQEVSHLHGGMSHGMMA